VFPFLLWVAGWKLTWRRSLFFDSMMEEARVEKGDKLPIASILSAPGSSHA
jgi:hypothetical protein